MLSNNSFNFSFQSISSNSPKIAIRIRSTDGGQTFQERTLDDEGKTTFKLKHAQSVVFYPITGEYTVTEDDPGSYTTTYSINGGTEIEGTSVTGTVPEDGSSLVKFVNTLETPLPTGVTTSDSAALAGIAMVMALLAIVYVGRRWRSIGE